MNDADLKKWHAHFQKDDLVRHHGTKQWGKVIGIRPTRYGVELTVERIVEYEYDSDGTGEWEGVRIDQHKRNGKRVVT